MFRHGRPHMTHAPGTSHMLSSQSVGSIGITQTTEVPVSHSVLVHMFALEDSKSGQSLRPKH
jgi:hypothetical protein